MTANEPQPVSTAEILKGLAIGALVPIGIGIVFSWPLVHYAIYVGVVYAVLLILPIGLPLCLYLRSRGKLNLYSAANVGGLMLALPIVLYGLFEVVRGGELGVYGWVYVLSAPLFYLIGWAGGAAGWLAIVGAPKSAQ